MKLVHIVPNVPPQICGVGDYANAVKNALAHSHPDIECQLFAAGTKIRERECGNPFWLWEGIANSIRGETPDAIILQYSGYGYAPNGAPQWLCNAFANRPNSFQTTTIVTFFHELYATAGPWRKTFWHTKMQKNVAERLFHCSDITFTNTRLSEKWLSKRNHNDCSLTVLPVPSNVGEPTEVPQLDHRENQAVLFGNPDIKRPFLKGKHAVEAARICRKLGIKRIIDIGKSELQFDLNTYRDIEIVKTGRLPGESVSKLLSSSMIGLMSYESKKLTKSGVFSAFSAHGLPVMGPRGIRCEIADNLDLGKQLKQDYVDITEGDSEKIRSIMGDIGRAAFHWNKPHQTQNHATILVNQLKGFYK